MTETLLVFNGILLGVLITLALECYAGTIILLCFSDMDADY